VFEDRPLKRTGIKTTVEREDRLSERGKNEKKNTVKTRYRGRLRCETETADTRHRDISFRVLRD
jgi:hypothetical protein